MSINDKRCEAGFCFQENHVPLCVLMTKVVDAEFCFQEDHVPL